MSEDARRKGYIVSHRGSEIFVPSTAAAETLGAAFLKGAEATRLNITGSSAELRRAIRQSMGKSCGLRIGRFVLRLRWLPRKPE